MPPSQPELSFDQRQKIQAGWSEFLARFEFNTFGTLTFQKPAANAEAAIRRGSRFLKMAYKRLGKHTRFPSFIVAEPFKGGGYHCHMLIRLPGDEDTNDKIRADLWGQAHSHIGRARFEKVRSIADVSAYVGKYLVKSPAGPAAYMFLGM